MRARRFWFFLRSFARRRAVLPRSFLRGFLVIQMYISGLYAGERGSGERGKTRRDGRSPSLLRGKDYGSQMPESTLQFGAPRKKSPQNASGSGSALQFGKQTPSAPPAPDV